jgi:hypothetical protein
MERAVISGGAIGMVGSPLGVSFFVANLRSFTDSSNNYKGMQNRVFGICVVKDAPYITQYQIRNIWQTK